MEIREVSSKKDLKRFITFPHQLYKNDENYVPTLNILTKRMLSKNNPFLKHSEIALFLAIDKNVVVGRIVAIFNKTHLDTYHDRSGFFGLFDSIDDISVAKILFETCEQWLNKKGVTRIIGPTNLTTNDSCGFLLEGFHAPPMVLMPYNKEYYNRLAMHSGYAKLIDLFSYNFDENFSFDRYRHIYEKGIERVRNNGIIVRNISNKTFKKDIERLRNVYNSANNKNWGFMPLNEEEFNEMANDLKITPWDLTLIVEKEEDIIGFLIALPDLNQVFKYVKNGKLFPSGLFQFLLRKKTVSAARILILGVLEEYRDAGIDFVMYKRIKEALDKRNIFNVEACYVLENNGQMNSILNKLSDGIIKKYRIYEKRIASIETDMY